MIKSFEHKGLQAFFETGSKAGIQPHHAPKLARLLARLHAAKVPEDLARQMAGLMFLSRAPDIIRVADETKTNLKAAAETFYAISEMFSVGPLITQAQALRLDDYYERIALSRTIDAISISQRRITVQLAGSGKTWA